MNKRELIEKTNSENWNIHDKFKGLSLEELKQICANNRLPYAVCAINVTGDLNIGMMVRSACLLRAEKFFIFGSTKYDKRSTVGAQNYIDVIRIDAKVGQHSTDLDYSNFIPFLNMHGYTPVFFETDGIALDEFDVKHDTGGVKLCLVFGNEGMGLPEELIKNQTVVTIPQYGVLRSLNVSAAASIAMYDISMQLQS